MVGKLMRGAALLAVLGACTQGANLATAPAAAPLPEITERRAVMGDVYVWERTNGIRSETTITSVTAELITASISDGCTFVSKRNAFAPNPEWNNCGDSSGTQTSKRLGDSIFPLALGSTESWEYSGNNNQGNSWESTRNCKVAGAVSVTVPAGTFDTYHVRCEDRWWVREWFVRADGVTVQWARTRKTGSPDRNRVNKLVSLTPA